MKISKKGIELLKEYEEFRGKAYLDSGGVPTIGYGTTFIKGVPVKMGMTCTIEQAEVWLSEDVYRAEYAINGCALQLTQNQFDALVSFVYNVGTTAFLKSTMLRKLHSGDPTAASEFDRWNKDGGVVVKGLVNRRRKERTLFETKEKGA